MHNYVLSMIDLDINIAPAGWPRRRPLWKTSISLSTRNKQPRGSIIIFIESADSRRNDCCCIFVGINEKFKFKRIQRTRKPAYLTLKVRCANVKFAWWPNAHNNKGVRKPDDRMFRWKVNRATEWLWEQMRKWEVERMAGCLEGRFTRQPRWPTLSSFPASKINFTLFLWELLVHNNRALYLTISEKDSGLHLFVRWITLR